MRHADRSPADLARMFLDRLADPRLEDLAQAVLRRTDAAGDTPRDVPSTWSNVLLNLVQRLGAEDGLTTLPTRLYWRQAQSGGRSSKYDRPKPRRDDRGEYLFDACWTMYPAARADWVRAVESGVPRPRLLLACVCEWATSVRDVMTADEHAGLILDDFAKLVDAPARHRWLMCSWTEALPFERIVSLCGRLAAPVEPGASYAIFGWRADAEWRDRRSVQTALLGTGA